jgi:hypothetical protein
MTSSAVGAQFFVLVPRTIRQISPTPSAMPIEGLPELLMIGGTAAAYLLNDLSEKMIERRAAFNDGELVKLGGKYPVKIINLPVRDTSTQNGCGAA